MTEISIQGAELFSISLLESYGVSRDHALIITEVVIDSELRGYDDYGLLFLDLIVQWGFTQGDWNPTTDPNDSFEWSTDGTLGSSGGAVLPIGGPKGYGMALVVDMLCGVLTGASFGMDLQVDTAK